MEDKTNDDVETPQDSETTTVEEDESSGQEDSEVGVFRRGPPSETKSRKQRLCVIFAILLAVVALSVGLGVGLGHGSSKSSKKSEHSKQQHQQDDVDKLAMLPPHYVDYSCDQDSDCVVMNVGNCCGYYPACLRKSSTPDPSKSCEEGGSSVCGFPSIESCVCTKLEGGGGLCQAPQGLDGGGV